MSDSEEDVDEISSALGESNQNGQKRDFIAAVAMEEEFLVEKKKAVTTLSILLFGAFALSVTIYVLSFTSFHSHNHDSPTAHSAHERKQSGSADLMQSQNAQLVARYGGLLLCLSTVAALVLLVIRKKEALYR